jgi:hypothetical protein
MKRIALCLALMLLCSPAFAYNIQNVIIESGDSVTADTVKCTLTARALSKSTKIYQVTLIPSLNNSNSDVFIGGTTEVSTTSGYGLVSGTSVTIQTSNLENIYVIGRNNTDKVNFIATKR